jgi:hypothetical protein
MTSYKYTVVCEFRGGTYVSQVAGGDVRDAVSAWIDYLAREKPIPHFSEHLARSVAVNLDDTPPVPLDGLSGVWCISGSCEGDFMLANIIASASSTNVR